MSTTVVQPFLSISASAHLAPDLLVDLEQRSEVRAPVALLREPAGAVERVRPVEGERAEHAQLLAGVLVAIARAHRQRAQHPIPDQEGHDRGRCRALRTELRAAAGPRAA